MMPTLIVEDGSKPEGANVYADLKAADDWLVPRGLWPATPVTVDAEDGTETPSPEMVKAKTAALLRAADWLNVLPGGRWKGEPVEEDRVMAFPRKCAPAVVPAGVKIANMELAAVFFGGDNPLAPLERGGKLASRAQSESKSVDVISKSFSSSVNYAEDAPVETFYPAVAGLLAPFLAVTPGKGGGAFVREVGRG